MNNPQPFRVVDYDTLSRLEDLLIAALGGPEEMAKPSQRHPLTPALVAVQALLQGDASCLAATSPKLPSVFQPGGPEAEVEALQEALCEVSGSVSLRIDPAALAGHLLEERTILRQLSDSASNRLGVLLAERIRHPDAGVSELIKAAERNLADSLWEHCAEQVLRQMQDENLLPGMKKAIA